MTLELGALAASFLAFIGMFITGLKVWFQNDTRLRLLEEWRKTHDSWTEKAAARTELELDRMTDKFDKVLFQQADILSRIQENLAKLTNIAENLERRVTTLEANQEEIVKQALRWKRDQS